MSSELLGILKRLELEELAALFAAQEIEDAVLPVLTDDDLATLGIDKLGPRKKLLAAFAELAEKADAPPPAPPTELLRATRREPFLNSLGLPFVPLPGSRTLFAAWTVRVVDYQRYCDERHLHYPDCEFAQTASDPVVNVSWREAIAFAEWLTLRERLAKTLPAHYGYRLPTDREWSIAVGLTSEHGRTPGARSASAPGYPWGDEFPPPENFGNYHWSLARDPFRETSPVASFAANALGIHDLGGNVWEWCMDDYDRESDAKVQRGASCFNDDDEYLLSSYRDRKLPDHRRNNTGIRLVLARTDYEPWY